MNPVFSDFPRRTFLKALTALGAAGTFTGWEPRTASAAEPNTDLNTNQNTEMASSAQPLEIPFSDVIPYSSSPEGKRWYRGNTHMHTFRSDGRAFADEAAALYRRLGYHFVVLTDHNTTHESPDRWIQLGTRNMTPEIVDRVTKTFPELKPEMRLNPDGVPQYRLRTFDEMSELLNEPERFLLICGNEISCASKNGDDIHCNLLNTRSGCRIQKLENTTENLDSALRIRDELVGRVNPEAIFMVNHPIWKFFDVNPMDLVSRPEIRFFEVANVEARPLFPVPEDFWTHDKFWDIVNAFRAAKGLPLLYGLASDDTHSYDMFYDTPKFIGYSMVQADSLTVPDLMRAFYEGNFYASTGLTLKEVRFDSQTRTLRVEIKPEPGQEYTIQFLGTRRGFRQEPLRMAKHQAQGEIPPWLIQAGFRPSRTLPVWSDEIGEVFHEVHGLSASWTLRPEDLYVRARIFAKDAILPENEHPTRPVAWTQPIANF